jgi:hypothetical protein
VGVLVRMGVCRVGALVEVSGGDSRLELRVTLRALQLLEVFLLPGVHDHLSGREQSRQRRLDHVGSILFEPVGPTGTGGRWRISATGSSRKGQTGDRRPAYAMDRRGTGVALVGFHGRGREQGPVELPES